MVNCASQPSSNILKNIELIFDEILLINDYTEYIREEENKILVCFEEKLYKAINENEISLQFNNYFINIIRLLKQSDKKLCKLLDETIKEEAAFFDDAGLVNLIELHKLFSKLYNTFIDKYSHILKESYIEMEVKTKAKYLKGDNIVFHGYYKKYIKALNLNQEFVDINGYIIEFEKNEKIKRRDEIEYFINNPNTKFNISPSTIVDEELDSKIRSMIYSDTWERWLDPDKMNINTNYEVVITKKAINEFIDFKFDITNVEHRTTLLALIIICNFYHDNFIDEFNFIYNRKSDSIYKELKILYTKIEDSSIIEKYKYYILESPVPHISIIKNKITKLLNFSNDIDDIPKPIIFSASVKKFIELFAPLVKEKLLYLNNDNSLEIIVRELFKHFHVHNNNNQLVSYVDKKWFMVDVILDFKKDIKTKNKDEYEEFHKILYKGTPKKFGSLINPIINTEYLINENQKNAYVRNDIITQLFAHFDIINSKDKNKFCSFATFKKNINAQQPKN